MDATLVLARVGCRTDQTDKGIIEVLQQSIQPSRSNDDIIFHEDKRITPGCFCSQVISLAYTGWRAVQDRDQTGELIGGCIEIIPGREILAIHNHDQFKINSRGVRNDILQALAGVDQVFICLEDDAG